MGCRITQLIEELKARKASIKCSDMGRMLKELGFSIATGKSDGHKVVTHDFLSDFYSTSYNCGHGKDPQIKPVYVGKIIGVLSDYAQDLKNYLESQK